jgi:pimeloyl-ACP methyl ester carboxylesterase
VTPRENYGWNWEPALNKLRIPWCAYTAPDHTLGNIETSGEYIVYAIRTMYQLSHRKIAILGHSQGGMSMRWALRFWPDTRKLVADVIGIAATNHGTLAGSGYGCDLGCPAGTWQQIVPNEFIPALNSYAETFAGISYTEIYTHEDVVATPNTDRSHCTTCLHTGGGQITDVAVQDICPGDQFEHIGLGTIDPVAYALAVDALTHPGPADPTRIPRSVCSQSTMPGVSSANWDGNLVGLASAIDVLAVVLGPAASLTSGAPLLDAEPPLDCYVTASCQGSLAPTLRIAYRLPRRRHGTRRILDVHVDALEGHRLQPVPQVTVTVAGEKGTTNAGGNVTLTLPARTTRRYRITASRAGCNPASKTVL